jgi:NAD(P)H-flavin reductase
VRKVGSVTSAIHELKENDEIGIRGPYGNHFPIDERATKFLFVAGGCSLAPLRSLIKYMVKISKNSSKLILLYGTRTVNDILFKEELNKWRVTREVEIYLAVEKGLPGSGYEIGVVSALFKKFKDLKDYTCFVCGPAKMMHFTIKELLNLNVKEENIILSLERYMKCGIGKCGHCYLKNKYVCIDGPVFTYKELRDLGAEP